MKPQPSSRAELICEIATAHGGDVDLACDMIAAARDAGADVVKTQAYDRGKINPNDPQASWLYESWLSVDDHRRLMEQAERVGVGYLSTPFDAGSLEMLRGLGLTRFKIASSESANDWWRPNLSGPIAHEHWYVSYPWGLKDAHMNPIPAVRLTAIPLYPTPLEAVGRATLLDGWSDHTEGIAACQWALAQGAKVIEAHFCLPGRSRQKSFDKTSQEFQQIRRFAEACATITSGVSETFRTRWSA